MRQIRKPRYPANQLGKFGQIVPILRAPVRPGESLTKLKSLIQLKSPPVAFPLTGAYVDVHFFYCPLRLADPAWPDAVIAGTYTPTTVTGNAKYFSSGSVPNLYGKCYEAVVNNWFRDQDGEEFTYTGGSTVADALAADMTSEAFINIGLDDPGDVLVPTTGDQVSIEAITDAMAKKRADEKRSSVDGNYEAHLSRLGVNVKGGFLMWPEYISTARKWVMPSKAVDQSTGNTVQTYMTSIEHQTEKRMYFPEHGYIIGVCTVRPKNVMFKPAPFEDLLPDVWLQGWERGALRQNVIVDLDETAWPSAGTNGAIDSRQVLMRGEHLNGQGVPEASHVRFTAFTDPNSVATVRYPSYSSFITGAGDQLSHDNEYELDMIHRVELKSDLRL